MKSSLFDFDLDVPMDMAVSLWRMIHDKNYRDAHQRLAAIADTLHQRRATELLEACENLDPTEIYDFVAEMQPTSYVIAHLVMMAKKSQRRATAKNGADATHRENRAMKADVFVWLDANRSKFKSMEAAAEAISGGIAPVKFRAARDWVGEWKKLRSAGTP